MNTPARRNLDALTGIRGIAAWGVVLYHIRLSLASILPPPVIGALGKGYLAVDLFFALSGFVIWYNYAARLANGSWAETRLFLWRRIARVWPLHAALLVAYAAFAGLLLATGRDASGYPWQELPLHVLLIQNWGLTPELAWNHPAWSISAELAAYLLFPALVLALRWERVPGWALLGGAALLAAALHALFAALGHDQLGQDIPGLGLWRCLAGFGLGCLACQLWQRWQALAGAALWSALGCMGTVAGGIALDLPETAWLPAACFWGLLALALGRGRLVAVLGCRTLIWLGEISYATYLAHVFLFILFKLVFVDASLQLGWGSLWAYLALLLVVSAGLYYGLERPAQAWLNARAPLWVRRSGAVPAE